MAAILAAKVSLRLLLTDFDAHELEQIVCGTPQVDIGLIRKRVEYSGYNSNSDQIKWLWNCLQDFNQEERASFLQFVTGNRRIPIYASQSRTWKLCIDSYGPSPDKLPTASTCFNQLHLPKYRSEEELKTKLRTAIEYGAEGFLMA